MEDGGEARVDGLGWDGVGCGEAWWMSWGGVCGVDWRPARRRSAHDTFFMSRPKTQKPICSICHCNTATKDQVDQNVSTPTVIPAGMNCS